MTPRLATMVPGVPESLHYAVPGLLVGATCTGIDYSRDGLTEYGMSAAASVAGACILPVLLRAVKFA